MQDKREGILYILGTWSAVRFNLTCNLYKDKGGLRSL
jgi:hypothetical protein